jgi:DNA-binding NarL/FixJ family response regulator
VTPPASTPRGRGRHHTRSVDVAIEAFHRAGNTAQLVITLASVPELLARLGALEAAATLHAAMMRIPASAEHVPELTDLGARLVAQLGITAAEAAAVGRAMDLDAAVAYARAQIAEAQQPAPVSARPGRLSPREVEVLRLMADGLTTRDIADRLFISAKTADRHIQNIYTKIGTSTRATATNGP